MHVQVCLEKTPVSHSPCVSLSTIHLFCQLSRDLFRLHDKTSTHSSEKSLICKPVIRHPMLN